jgi:carbon monoxide dehydrogenase subunit G
MMEFEGAFRIPGRPDDVMLQFTDIERMARCMPGASLEGRDEEGNYLGVMTVAFGPKKIKFRGKVRFEFDIPARSGMLRGRGAADLRAARIEMRTSFSVAPDPEAPDDAPMSVVKLSSEADLQGVLADFAKTGGTALANVIMEDFAKRLAAEFSGHGGDPDSTPTSISAHKLVWQAIKSKLS